MPPSTEEIAWAPSARGELSLRQWGQPLAGPVEYELTLNRVCATSSHFAAAGTELVRRALEGLDGQDWQVALAGFGLGFTAAAVLDDRRVAGLLIVETTRDIGDWARQGLLPDGERVLGDPRTRLREGDFPAALRPMCDAPFGPARRFHAVMVNVSHWVNAEPDGDYRAFRHPAHLRRVTDVLRPGGILAVWSDLPPDMVLLAALRQVFAEVVARPLILEIPEQDVVAVHTQYVARTARHEAGPG